MEFVPVFQTNIGLAYGAAYPLFDWETPLGDKKDKRVCAKCSRRVVEKGGKKNVGCCGPSSLPNLIWIGQQIMKIKGVIRVPESLITT